MVDIFEELTDLCPVGKGVVFCEVVAKGAQGGRYLLRYRKSYGNLITFCALLWAEGADAT